jgi:predicted nucleotidyltransferase component of viral defense system
MIAQSVIRQWRSRASWISDSQVEQDLVLSRAMVELFGHAELSKNLALRGGTSFNKLYLRDGARYSEDIDLVQVEAAPIGPTISIIRELLGPWLGEASYSASKGNATLRFGFAAEADGGPMGLKVEINTREHFAVFGYAYHRYTMETPWFEGKANVQTYVLDELLGTKMRALYQRKKSRDLFDLWRGMTTPGVSPENMVKAFKAYMKHGSKLVTAEDYVANLAEKLKDKTFMTDIRPLLAPGQDYDPHVAGNMILKKLIPLMKE